MKKIALVLGLFLLPVVVSAQTVGFTNNISYGSTGSEVSQLQEFLITQGVLAPQYDTGNFYSLTLQAVKTFQSKEGITPVSGFVGPITRATINAILTSEVPIDEGNASTTTPPVDLSKTAPTTNVIPVTVPDTQTPVITPTEAPSAPQQTFGSISCTPNPQLNLGAVNTTNKGAYPTVSIYYTTGCPIVFPVTYTIGYQAFGSVSGNLQWIPETTVGNFSSQNLGDNGTSLSREYSESVGIDLTSTSTPEIFTVTVGAITQTIQMQ